MNADPSCIFCRIVAREAEASVLYDDDITSAKHAYIEDGRIKYGTEQLPSPTREELDRLANLLS